MDPHDQLDAYIRRISGIADELELITRGLAEWAERAEIRFAANDGEGYDDDDEPVDDDARPDKPTY